MPGKQKRSNHIICFRFCLGLTLSRHIVVSFIQYGATYLVAIRDIKDCFNSRHNIVLTLPQCTKFIQLIQQFFLIKQVLVFIKATCLVVTSVCLL